MRPEEPNWQPVAAVTTLTGHVAEQLADTRIQLALIEQARPTRADAKILGDHDVSETLRVYGVMATDYEHLFAEQGRRWQAETLDPGTTAKVEVYVALVADHLALLDEILTLARQIEPHTIEKILAKSDAELGIETLLGLLGRPD